MEGEYSDGRHFSLHPSPVTLYPEKIQSASQPRTITIGVQKVAEEPTDDDLEVVSVEDILNSVLKKEKRPTERRRAD